MYVSISVLTVCMHLYICVQTDTKPIIQSMHIYLITHHKLQRKLNTRSNKTLYNAVFSSSFPWQKDVGLRSEKSNVLFMYIS